MSEEKSTPQSHAPEAEGLSDDALESVSGGRSVSPPGCILILPIEPGIISPIDPVICPIELEGPTLIG